MRPDVSIIIPAFNEAKIIRATLRRVADFLSDHPALGHVQVIVVAAKGTDTTAAIAQKCSSFFDDFSLVTPPSRAGKGRDVRLGFLAATGKKQLFFDADLATPLHHIPEILKLLDDHDIAIGTRNLQKVHQSTTRRVISTVGNGLVRLLGLSKFGDTQCGFKAFKASAAKQLFANQHINGWGFDVELLAQARQRGMHIAELPLPDWKNNESRALSHDSRLKASLTTFGDLLRVKGYLLWPRVAALLQKSFVPVTLLTIGAVFALCINGISQGSIWYDEGYSALIIQKPWHLIFYFTAFDVHPPLYYLTLKTWTTIFGHTELGLRSLSAIFAAAAAGMGLVTLKSAFGKKVAVFAAPFVVLAPLLLRYGQEARMYAMASFLCITATFVAIQLDKAMRAGQPTRKLTILYGVLIALCFYTHYYTALVWLVHLVWWWRSSKQPLKVMWKTPWANAFKIGVGAFLPWAIIAAIQVAVIQTVGFWIQTVSHQNLLDAIALFFSYHAQWQVMSWGSMVLIVATAASVVLWRRVGRRLSGNRLRYFKLFSFYAWLPLAILFVMSLPPFQPAMIDRYYSIFLLGAYLLLGVIVAFGLRLHGTRKLALFTALVVFGSLIWGVITLKQVSNYNFNRVSLPQSRDVVQAMNPGNVPVMVDDPQLFYEVQYYAPNTVDYDGQVHLYKPVGGELLLNATYPMLSALPVLSKQQPAIWYVYAQQNDSFKPPAAWQDIKHIDVGAYHAIEYALVGNGAAGR